MSDPRLPPGVTEADIDALSPTAAEEQAADLALAAWDRGDADAMEWAVEKAGDDLPLLLAWLARQEKRRTGRGPRAARGWVCADELESLASELFERLRQRYADEAVRALTQ